MSNVPLNLPCFCEPLDDQCHASRWRQIFTIMENWYHVPRALHRYQSSTTTELAGINRPLPDGVRWWKSLIEIDKEAKAQLSLFRDDPTWQFDAAWNAIVLMREAEGGFYWGVPVEHLNTPDPAVYTFPSDDEQPRRCKLSVSEFLVSYMLLYINEYKCVSVCVDEDWFRQMREFFDRDRVFCGYHFFERANLVCFYQVSQAERCKLADVKLVCWDKNALPELPKSLCDTPKNQLWCDLSAYGL